MSEERPSVKSEQIKQLLSEKNQKNQHHASYNYYKSETIEEEINEFIAYSEVKSELQQYEAEYNDTYSPWEQCSLEEKKSIIQQATDYLDLLEEEKRLLSAKSLVYISLGCFAECMGDNNKTKHLLNLQENNRLLYSADLITTLKKSLDYGCHQLENLTICQTELVESFCKEIDIYLTILYMIILFNKDRLDEYKLPEFLFDLVVRLKEHFTKTFPLKKLMLNLYKVLSVTMGDNYSEMKSNIRIVCDLPIVKDKSTFIKCTPEDLYSFYHQSCERYPTFKPPTPPEKIKNPLTISASPQLSKAMGLYKASKNIDLPYQTLFPSKNQPTSHINAAMRTKPSSSSSSLESTNILPYTENSPMIPKCLVEASSIWVDHLYLSVANYQIIYEREKTIHRWQRQGEKIDDWKEIIYDKLNEKDQQKMAQIESLYKSIVPNFQNIVVVLLKLLLSTVSIGKDKEAEILEDINITRNREIISKSVSGILLLMLKWFKLSHVLKFEYLSQILIDSGCMLLILKLLGLQEVALLASKKTDDDSLSFFGYVRQVRINYDSEEEEEEERERLYTNNRNLFWSINLLRILQMLTKRKTHRILLLVQYKSSAILKRLLKVGHPVMDLYVLKNLKNQVPFMGKKWRSSNMKTISSIYARCLTSLNDEWLSSPEGNGDMEDGAMKEISLRMLSRLYNGQRYLPNILPKMDDISGTDSTLFYFNNCLSEDKGRRLPDYNLNEPVLVDDVELDMEFKNNYQNWLSDNVYTTTDEDEEDEEDEVDSDTGHIGTPLPDAVPVPITADELANEINKLYLEELRREFKEKKEKQSKSLVQEDGWDKPTAPTTPWGSIPLDNTIQSNQFEEDEEADEVEPTVDPLQGINWDDLTEEELKNRLTLVQEKTVQRWLNVEMDDPRYMKVLNCYEGETLVDDEGWPI